MEKVIISGFLFYYMEKIFHVSFAFSNFTQTHPHPFFKINVILVLLYFLSIDFYTHIIKKEHIIIFF